MNKNHTVIALLGVAVLLILFLVYKLQVSKNQNTELLKSLSLYQQNSQEGTTSKFCDDVLFREQKEEVKGYKFFIQCNFVSGEYGDNDSKNVFGIQNIKTGQKYIIGSMNGIFDQNTILDVVDGRYVFLTNSYEGESRYIMVDTSNPWPTQHPLISTVYPRTIDQYIEAKLSYKEIINKFLGETERF